MRTLNDAVQEMVERHDRFTYDLRARCRVLSGSVAAYRAEQPNVPRTDLSKAITQALDSDGILGAWRHPDTGEVQYDSCRVFTDQDQALRFAEEQGQRSVFNLNRMIEVSVSQGNRTVKIDVPTEPWLGRVFPLRA